MKCAGIYIFSCGKLSCLLFVTPLTCIGYYIDGGWVGGVRTSVMCAWEKEDMGNPHKLRSGWETWIPCAAFYAGKKNQTPANVRNVQNTFFLSPPLSLF